MIEFFKHMFGLCPDHYAHTNLMVMYDYSLLKSIKIFLLSLKFKFNKSPTPTKVINDPNIKLKELIVSFMERNGIKEYISFLPEIVYTLTAYDDEIKNVSVQTDLNNKVLRVNGTGASPDAERDLRFGVQFSERYFFINKDKINQLLKRNDTISELFNN
jgi:hypothetical protein